MESIVPAAIRATCGALPATNRYSLYMVHERRGRCCLNKENTIAHEQRRTPGSGRCVRYGVRYCQRGQLRCSKIGINHRLKRAARQFLHLCQENGSGMVFLQLDDLVLIFTAVFAGFGRLLHAAFAAGIVAPAPEIHAHQFAHAVVQVQGGAGRGTQVQNG